MPADAAKVRQQYLDRKHLEYHRKQLEQPKRSTVALAEFVGSLINGTNAYSVLDVGCGAGANIYHLSHLLPNSQWTGLDINEALFTLARESLQDVTKYRLIGGDFYQLQELFGQKAFDIAFSIQTLSWLPDYETALAQITSVTRQWIFVTSLFSDFLVDAFTTVWEYSDDLSPKEDSPYNYNVYSYPKFSQLCYKMGAKHVVAKDFTIDIDLPPPPSNGMGTYTRKSADGVNLQFSGPLHMPWKMIGIQI